MKFYTEISKYSGMEHMNVSTPEGLNQYNMSCAARGIEWAIVTGRVAGEAVAALESMNTEQTNGLLVAVMEMTQNDIPRYLNAEYAN